MEGFCMKKNILKIIFVISFFILGWMGHSFYQQKQKESSKPKSTTIVKPLTILEKIKAKKQLNVIILNAPTVYYVGADNYQGFEYDLISAFAKSINVKLNLTVVHTIKEALELTRKNIADITVASLTATKEREKKFKFGPYYHSITEQLICHKSLFKQDHIPQSIDELVDLNITVAKDTNHEATLNKIKNKIEKFDFNTTIDFSTEELLYKIWKKEINCTVADSHAFMISQRYYPELIRVMNLSERKNLGWIIQKGDNSLSDALFRWLNKFERSGKMAELNGFYFDFLNIFDYYDTKIFHKRLKSTLPKYEKYFKKAGKKYHIPWVILAAQSYQESHWNPNAKSFTGVRGMMMLTNNTAKLLEVKNRINPKESIFGGAKYFAMMRKIFPKEIEGKNLWAFTLAAYNVGLGHIYDAQKLAKKLNKNPYSWKDLKTVLPLLSQKKYYKNLKYGYARGTEPVRYVDAIQHYYDIIVQSKMPKVKTLPKSESNTTKDSNNTKGTI